MKVAELLWAVTVVKRGRGSGREIMSSRGLARCAAGSIFSKAPVMLAHLLPYVASNHIRSRDPASSSAAASASSSSCWLFGPCRYTETTAPRQTCLANRANGRLTDRPAVNAHISSRFDLKREASVRQLTALRPADCGVCSLKTHPICSGVCFIITCSLMASNQS